MASTSAIVPNSARLRDLAARERSARHQAEQWAKANRPSAARDIRQHADRLREMRRREGGRG